jgi:hypothetical protein
LTCGALAFLLAPFAAPSARPETLDRVVATIGNRVITQSDVEQEYGFERFLQGAVPDHEPSPAEFQAALDRLIGQKLLQEEMQNEAAPEVTTGESNDLTLASVRSKFATPAGYQKALDMLQMTQDQAQRRLEVYQRTLRFVDDRFRDQALPSESEIKEYYQSSFVPAYTRQHSPPVPTLARVHDQIMEIVTQQKINQLLAAWLKDLRQARGVKILGD